MLNKYMKINMTHAATVIDAAAAKLLDTGFDDVLAAGGRPYFVGGFVRDAFLGREAKDIDVVVDGLSMPELVGILEKRGKVDLVGKSFAVLKFKAGGETVDVAVPRADAHVEGGGHKDVKIVTGGIGIREDLFRRDFTINAIASNFNCVIIDPTGGLKDLESGVIRCVDGDAFAMDPLRMLRAVVFAARFGFEIHADTARNIEEHAEWIKRIPGERIEAELRKAWEAGAKVSDLVNGLMTTGLYKNMFGLDRDFAATCVDDPRQTYADFFYHVLEGARDPEEQYAKALKGDSTTANEIGTIRYALVSAIGKTKVQVRRILQRAIEHAPGVINSAVLDSAYGEELNKFKSGEYPKSRRDLAVTGEDLVVMRVAPENRGNMFKGMIEQVLSDALPNERAPLLKWVSMTNNAMNNDE
jgi:tRNA nucleotidyltransferase/poly(A) polymerase